MVFLKRISLFIMTNILVMVTISVVMSIVMSVFKIDPSMGSYGGLLVYSAVIGMTGSFISLLLSKFMAKSMMGLRMIEPGSATHSETQLLRLVAELSQRAGLPKTPEVGIYESPDINAFATGPSRSSALVAVSTGLLDRMTPDEVEGVIGHEISHIANGDMVTLTLIQGIVNTFSIFLARIISSIISQQVESRNRHIIRYLIYVVFEIAFTILGSIIVRYFSRQREFRADAGSAKITSRDKMIAALRKLKLVYESHQVIEEEPRAEALSAFKISNSGKEGGFMALFSTHPALDDRIDRLRSGVTQL